MSGFYIMAADTTEFSDYIYLDTAQIPDKLKWACVDSAFQHIDKNLHTLLISAASEDALPDFLYDPVCAVPLISERLKQLFDSLDIRNLFYQRVWLERRSDHISQSYWLAVPPRISCLDLDKSIITSLERAERMVIERDKIGNYEIFKTADAVNTEIIVTEKLKNAVEEKGFTEGFGFYSDEHLI